MSAQIPLGYQSAAADWDEVFAGRPYTLADWNSLTFGEQERYGAQECKTKGAMYHTSVNNKTVRLTVELPTSLVGHGFTAKESKWLESALHKAAERTIHWVLVRRAMVSESKGGQP